ncbi:MAG: phosphomannomutase [Planctomycetaceae bacterium]|jgi:phosphomannomutase|nr:phosphomannomutase [Planctomycetaceae bacterium]
MEISINSLMASSNVRFGTSGVRGLVEKMTDKICFAYTVGFLQYAVKRSPKFDRVVVAYDLRASSPRISRVVRSAIDYCGFVPVDCGMISTPALMLFGLQSGVPSIMVTGSHISDDRNGIKFNLSDGEILKSDENAIRQEVVKLPDDLFDDAGILLNSSEPAATLTDKGAAKQNYISRFIRAFPKDILSGSRIGFYEHSSVGRDLLVELYTKLGATVTRLGRSEKFISVDTEAVREEDLLMAKNWSQQGNSDIPPFDVILSTDGDADRPLIFDEHGEWLRGDVVGILAARFLLADCVVTPVSSSSALELSGWFGKIIRTKIGSPYVVEAMKNAVKQGYKRVVGYEANGGFLTASSMFLDEDASERPLDALPTRDPAIVHIATLCFARSIGASLSEVINHLPRRVVMSDRLKNFPTELAKREIDELANSPETIQLVFASLGELVTYDLMDGIRIVLGDGDIVHLRPSGNAPELRCYAEAVTKERANSLLCKTMNILDSWRRRTQNDKHPLSQ